MPLLYKNFFNNTHLSFVFKKSVDVDEHCEDEDDCRSNERQVLWKLVVRPKHKRVKSCYAVGFIF